MRPNANLSCENEFICMLICLKRQPTFCNTTNCFPTKCLRNKHRNSILTTCHYPDLDSASDWLRKISLVTQNLGSDTLSVWNFCTHFSDIISLENQWWHCEMSADFSDYMLINEIISTTEASHSPSF